MTKVTNYTEFSINEEFLGGIFNFFKGLFKKIAAQIQKLNDDPNTIKDFIQKNLLDPNSANNLFKKELENFAKEAETKPVDDASCFKLIDSVLNKESGVLGKQGIGTLLADKLLQGDNQKVKRLTIEYIINTAREQVSKKIGYDPTKIKDANYIKGLKMYSPTETPAPATTATTPAAVPAAQPKTPVTPATTANSSKIYNYTTMQKIYEDDVNNAVKPEGTQDSLPDTSKSNDNVESVKKWFNENIVNSINAYVKAIKEDDIKAAVAKGGVSTSEYKVGDTVRYKMKSFIEGTSPEEQKDNIGSLPIKKIEGDKFFFTDKKGAEFSKTKDQIIGKAEGDESDGSEVDALKNKLSTMKGNKEQMDKVLNYANFISDPKNANKPFVETTGTPSS